MFFNMFEICLITIVETLPLGSYTISCVGPFIIYSTKKLLINTRAMAVNKEDELEIPFKYINPFESN